MSKWSDLLRFARGSKEPSEEPDPYVDPTPGKAGTDAPEESRGLLARLRKGSKRDQQLAALHAGYAELLELIRAIRQHLDDQAEGRDKLLGHLDHLPDAVDALQNVGKSAEQQTEVLQLVRSQLESGARHDEHLIDSMKRFNQTLELMDKTSRNSADTMSRLAERTRESEEILGGMLERSERRLVAVISLLVLMTIAVIGAGIYFTTADRRAHAGAEAVVSGAAPIQQHAISGLPGRGMTPAEVDRGEPSVSEGETAEGAPVPTDEEWEEWRKGTKKRKRFLFFGRSR